MAADADSDIRQAQAITLLEKLAANSEARSAVWEYVRVNAQAILDSPR